MALPLQHPVVRPNASGRRRPEDSDVSWRERLQALKHLPRLLRLVWETEPRYVVGILVLRVLRSLVPLAVLWVGKLIVDEVVTSIGSVHAGGEWQKVALARAYMREAQLLILDEPTAALDARAEYEVFLRFSELTRGRMAVLISHRFSTVRMADRILVLQGGELVEQGTHEALVAQGGLYAELFQLQAAGYR